jgi:hypothetical protein
MDAWKLGLLGVAMIERASAGPPNVLRRWPYPISDGKRRFSQVGE